MAELLDLLVDTPIGGQFTVDPAEDICYSLELFLPRLLATQHPEWVRESLDGFFVARAIKTQRAGAELTGFCIIISDQTVTPFRVELAIDAPEALVLDFVHVRLGEAGGGELSVSGPPVNSSAASSLLASLLPRIDSVRWSYDLQFSRANQGEHPG